MNLLIINTRRDPPAIASSTVLDAKDVPARNKRGNNDVPTEAIEPNDNVLAALVVTAFVSMALNVDLFANIIYNKVRN